VKALRVLFDPDADGWWAVSIPAVKGVRSDGRTLEEARRKIREALASAEDLGWNERKAAAVELVEEIRLPADLLSLLDERVAALKALELAASEVERTTTDLVRRLTAAGRSLRDVAGLLALSHGRIHQILEGSDPVAARTDRRTAVNRALVASEAPARYRTRRRR
jgi:vacuolar-type H+-ATPase subunit I/STV1